MANLRKEDGRSSSSNRSNSSRSNRSAYTRNEKEDAAVVVTGCGCLGALVLAKIAFWVAVLWMAYLLVSWVVTK